MARKRHSKRILLADGQGIKGMLIAGTTWLEKHVPMVNALNVFPVPDGDTGTNMFLTMQASIQEMEATAEHTAGAVLHAAAHGALMGARGNSGVILSQILRGMARSVAKKETITVNDLAAAFAEGAATAYKGVIKPVEGTLLSVARDVAEAAAVAAKQSDDLRYLLEAVVAAARSSVARTPDLLPVLKEAGVVDAGGQGLAIILEGAWRYLNGEDLTAAVPAYVQAADLRAAAGEYGYDVQFVLEGDNLDLEAIRQKIATMGDSVLVVGDSHTIKVHVHTNNPGEVLSYGAGQGTMSRVIVENMQEQYRAYAARQAVPSAPPPPAPSTDIAIVAVASGDGLTRVFQSLGASSVVPGGQSMNPSTAEILRAIDEAPADKVIVLPNNKNIVMAARTAQELSSKQVVIVPSHTIPQGIAALLAFNYEADLETNRRSMEQAMAYVKTAEITVAVRSTQIDGLQVRAGAFIGLLDGKLVVTGDDIDAVLRQILDLMAAREREVITIYYGENVTPAEAERTRDLVRDHCPEQTVELVDGGQPYYYYIISAE